MPIAPPCSFADWKKPLLYIGIKEEHITDDLVGILSAYGFRPDTIMDELCGPLYSVTSGGKIQIEPKAQMKRRLGRSPDKADAFCLTFAGVAAAVSGSGGYSARWGQPLRRAVKGVV